MNTRTRLLILLAVAAAIAVVAYWTGNRRTANYKEKQHQSFISHLSSIIHAVDDEIVNNQIDEKPQPALYDRLRNQISTLEDLYVGRHYFAVLKNEDGYRVGLCSKTNSEYKKGDPYSVGKQVEEIVFGHHKPFVEEVMQNGKLHKIKVFVPIFPANYKNPILFVMELKGKSYFEKQTVLRRQAYIVFTLLALIVIICLVIIFWRNDLPAEKQNRFVHVETIGFFFVGLWLVIISAELYREAKKDEQQLIFNNYGVSASTVLRSTFREIGHHLEELGVFLANSEEVDSLEFANCAYQILIKYHFESLFLFETSDLKHSQSAIRLTDVDGSELFLKYHQEANTRSGYLLLSNQMIVDSLQDFLFQSGADRLLHSTGFIRPPSLNGDGMIVIGYKIPDGPQDGRHNKYKRFLAATIDPQRIIEQAFRNAEWLKMDMAVDLVEYINRNQSQHIGSFPFSHYRAASTEELDAHFASVEFVKASALLIWGDFYVMKLHSLEGYSAGIIGLRTKLFYFAGFIMLLLGTLVIFFYRRHSQMLEILVDKRSRELNRRIRDLVCIRNVTQMLQSEKDITTNLGDVGFELENTLFPNKEAYIEFLTDGVKIISSGRNGGKRIAASFDLKRNHQIVGSLKVKSDEPVRLEEEDMLLLNQIVTKINNYLDHFRVTKELRDSETKFRSLVENAFDAIYILSNRQFLYVNKAFSSMVGYTEAELTSPDFDLNVLLTPFSKTIVEQHISDRRKGIAVPKRYEFQQLAKDGRVVDVEASTVVVELEGKSVTIGMLHDITTRKRNETILINSEERLQQQNEELQVLNEELNQTNDQMRQMNADLIEAKHKAEASDRLKTAFLNNISHELRTPLNGILGASSMILEGGFESEAERIEMEAVLNLSSNRLVRTIEQYVDISMLASDTMPVKKEIIKPRRSMENTVKNFLNLCKHKNLRLEIEIEVDDEFVIETDRNLFEKIVDHLLDNAVKFTPSGNIRFRLSKTASGGLLAEIHDSGVGIQDDFKPHIYELFTQQENSTVRRFDGSGLGLSIVKRCCEIIGATIRFESKVGVGTSFYVELQGLQKTMTNKAEPEKVERQTLSGDLKNMTVLIAEDEDSNYAVLDVVLVKRLNIQIIRAENGVEAVELCAKHPEVDLCLMDIKMPVMDGYDATRLIKQMRPQLPVIAITAFGLIDDDRKAYAAGCDDYLSKPFQVNTLLEKVRYWLSTRPKNDEKQKQEKGEDS